MSIRVYNTLSRKKETFRPIDKKEVRMYACGPTVYNYFHIGNARTFVMSDVIRRYLVYAGYRVRFVMNITDVDDRIIQMAMDQKVPSADIADEYTKAFIEDLGRLGVQEPDVLPRATGHIADMIDMIQTLVEKGYAYALEGSVYFEAAKFEGYGKLSGKNIEDLQAGARVEVDQKKRNPADFALWKKSKEGEPFWDSPWGKGRPGWHIECSAMSVRHLGEQIDLHTGGNDLIFPHHENEIAQSEGCTGHPFVRYWLHMGFLNKDDEKMSKSLGNFFTAREILEKYRPEVIRMFFLQKHYRSPLAFSDATLNDARSAHQRIETAITRVRQLLDKSQANGGTSKTVPTDVAEIRKAIEDAMNDDFNTAKALGHVFDLITRLNAAADAGSRDVLPVLKAGYDLFNDVNAFFGVYGISPAEAGQTESAGLINLLIEIRKELRARKHFELGDRIRDELARLGITLKDTPQGTEWRIN